MDETPVWDGITKPESLNAWVRPARDQLANGCKSQNWPAVMALLHENPSFVNAARPGGKSLFAPLHQAAYGSAPLGVIDQLIRLGAWRGLRTAAGDRAVDIAERRGHDGLIPLLTPPLLQRVDASALGDLQRHFHALIYGRVANLVIEHALRLPQLECLLEMSRPTIWFPVPGMCGGFSFTLQLSDTARPTLIVASWCRAADGSGERHEVTTEGYRLLEAGFV